jgi:hypothetical protein
MPTPVRLRDVFHAAKRKVVHQGWLYLPSDTKWGLDTVGLFVDDEDEHDGNYFPLVAKTQNLVEALEGATIEDAVDWADMLSGAESDEARLDVFLYYYKFDAFPDKIGAPDPPPADVTIARLDREFYDSLGTERNGTQCKRPGCGRGTVSLSVFCRRHHFENVQRKPCPFTD